MASLGITVSMVLNSVCKPYLDTLSAKDKATYLSSMASSVGTEVQATIDEAQGMVDSATVGIGSVIDAVPSFTTASMSITPTEPAAAVGIIAANKGSVNVAKTTIYLCSTQLAQASSIVKGWGLPKPQAIADAEAMVVKAINLLNNIS